MEQVQVQTNPSAMIRAMVRGVYDLQSLRIQMGNRITANFKVKIGMDTTLSEKAAEKAQKDLLAQLRNDYNRITDGFLAEGEDIISLKIPSYKKFKPQGLIGSYAELSLVKQYMALLAEENASFAAMEKILGEIPIYTEWLKDVPGIGKAMAAIIISEIDISKAMYPSSLWKLAGLDVVSVAYIKDDNGKEVYLTKAEHTAALMDSDDGDVYFKGKQVFMTTVGRSKKDFCLENRPYINKDGEEAVRRSITFNPFLKTKLIGVLGGSFLKCGTATVDGKRCGVARRLEMAVSEGFKADQFAPDDVDVEVIKFLLSKAHDVIVEPSPFGKVYYDYKHRIENMAEHKEKTAAHRHNMAIRYAVKIFLQELYNVWRPLEGLPVAPTYAEAKLGLTHHEISVGKIKKTA